LSTCPFQGHPGRHISLYDNGKYACMLKKTAKNMYIAMKDVITYFNVLFICGSSLKCIMRDFVEVKIMMMSCIMLLK
jgi:hypothetical protein